MVLPSAGSKALVQLAESASTATGRVEVEFRRVAPAVLVAVVTEQGFHEAELGRFRSSLPGIRNLTVSQVPSRCYPLGLLIP